MPSLASLRKVVIKPRAKDECIFREFVLGHPSHTIHPIREVLLPCALANPILVKQVALDTCLENSTDINLRSHPDRPGVCLSITLHASRDVNLYVLVRAACSTQQASRPWDLANLRGFVLVACIISPLHETIRPLFQQGARVF